MKKIARLLFCLSLGITALTGCESKYDLAKDNFKNIYFDFVYYWSPYQMYDYISLPVTDVINLTEDEFNQKYITEEVKNRFDYYTYHEMTYYSGEKFVFDYESIRTYLNDDLGGARKKFPDRKLTCEIQLKYTPIEYHIQYLGYEDGSLSPTTYIYGDSIKLPVIEDTEYRKFLGWREQGTNVYYKQTPTFYPKDLVLEPVFEYVEFSITYSLPFEITNPNPTSYTYYDNTIELIDFPDHPDGAYTFEGFYLDGEKITSIDPHMVKNLDIECRFSFKEYTAKYYDGDQLIDTITFTYATMNKIVPPSVPQKDHFVNGSWDDKVTEPKNYEIHAVYDREVYNITYEYPFEGISNPNITTFTAFDGEVSLKSLADSPQGYYTFDGFYLNGNKITKLDTSIGQNITIEARFNIKEYEVKYYDGNDLLFTDTFTFLTFKDYVQRPVPNKDHYKNGEWSKQVTEIKNYNIYAHYDAEEYVVTIKSNVNGETSNQFTITYDGKTTIKSLTDTLDFDDKYFTGVYSDSKYTTPVDINSIVDKNMTLYAKWATEAYISSASDWSKIVNDPAGHYTLANDISFTMDQVPVIDNFTGILDGDSHKIQRFANNVTGCASNYGLFKTNNGTIKNLILEDCSFVSSNADGSGTVYCGLLCGTNKGTIDNVNFISVTANITANYYITIDDFNDHYGYCYAGLCCGNNQGTITNCYIKDDSQLSAKARIGYYKTSGVKASGSIYDYGYFYYGLLAGLNTGTITNITSNGKLSVNSITVSESKKGWSYALMDGVRYSTRSGGVVGRNGNGSNTGTVKNCVGGSIITIDYAEPAVSTSFSSDNRLGGIVGNNEATIENCYTSDTAKLINKRNGDLEMGGIVGRIESTGKVKGCYSECKFSSDNSSGVIRIGGIAGCNCGSLSYCHATVSNITISGSNSRGGGIGALVGYTNDTSTIMFCVGQINIADAISIVSCYDIGNATTNAILNKVSIYASEQTNTINHNDKSTSVGSLEELIDAARAYYFDEVGFTLHNNELPTLEGIGQQF